MKNKNSKIEERNDSNVKESLVQKNNKKPNTNDKGVFVYALGGLGEVGKNMYVVETEKEIWIMDSGIKFSSNISIEGVIPSFEHLENNKKKIKGLIITHGHEDHIGSVPHLLQAIPINKIYAGRIAANLIWNKLKERGVRRPKIEFITNKSYIKSDDFFIDFFNVNHSIPDCYGVTFKSKHGVIINTADFKFDFSPVGTRADLHKMANYGEQGVTLALSDSTNAQSQDFSLSERVVSENLDSITSQANGRVIIATFASNILRVREIIKIALRNKRKILVFGYSMDKVITISRKIKYINVPDDLFITSKEARNLKDKEILVISTGTQGETLAALSKMAHDKHKEIKLRKEDTIVFASSAIPGNYASVEKVTNELIKKGCKVLDNKIYPGIHASGHGGKQEQLLMFNLLKPEYFMPVHGEIMMQVKHAKTAVESGVSKNNIFIVKNGSRLNLKDGVVTRADDVPAEDIYVDDTNLKGQSLKVISDRDNMGENGVVVVNIQIDSSKNLMLSGPELNFIGVFNESSNKMFINEIRVKLKNQIENYYKKSNKITFNGLKEIMKYTVENEIYNKKKIRPIVMPMILNKNDYLVKKQSTEKTEPTNKKQEN